MKSLADRPDLTMKTRAVIRSAIMSGELQPGMPLAQHELAQQLGVSRQPISHALKLLRQEGLVVDRGRKGQMVAPIDADKLLALYQVRGALDRLAAQLAASRGPDKASRQLGLVAEEGLSLASAGNPEALVAADEKFHRLLHDASGNPEIGVSTELLWPHLVRSMRVVLDTISDWDQIWREHQAIADAVITGNAIHAGDLAAKHAEDAGFKTHQQLCKLYK